MRGWRPAPVAAAALASEARPGRSTVAKSSWQRASYGDGHEKGLDAETLQDLLDAGWFQTDHVFSCTGDDPENFILMPKTLNTKFSFHTEQDFKKEWTGDAWKGAEYLVRKAIKMQQRIHRH